MNPYYEIKDSRFIEIHYDLSPLKDVDEGSLEVKLGYSGTDPSKEYHKVKIKVIVSHESLDIAVFVIGYTVVIHGVEVDKQKDYIEEHIISDLTKDSTKRINEIFNIMNMKVFEIPDLDI